MGISRVGFKKLIKVEEANKLIEEKVKYKITDYEEINILNSLNRICYEDVISEIDIPPFDRAAMDGYAVKAEDTMGASIKNPVILKVIGKLEPGMKCDIEVNHGQAIEISTGAPIPRGADSVIPYEETKIVGDIIEVYSQIHPLKNISLKGEDVKKGDVVLRKGTIIKPWDIGVLASINIVKIRVLRKPLIGILSTGTELVEPGTPLSEGKIINSTKIMLKALILNDNGIPVDLGNVGDYEDEICKALLNAVDKCDVIVTTGGASIGMSDKTVNAIKNIGGEIIFHGVAMRPGKPTGLALLRNKPIIMLSGFPVAALTGYQNFVRKLLECICEMKFQLPLKIKAKISRRVASQLGSREYLRVKLIKNGEDYIAIPLRLTGSGILSSITQATGIVEIPEDVEGIEENESVEVILFRELTAFENIP